MENFYKLLSQYNQSILHSTLNMPEWTRQYIADNPPFYWVKLYELLKDENNNQSLLEIGGGYGDVTSLLYFLGFDKVICVDRDISMLPIIRNKVKHLFNKEVTLYEQTYPCKLNSKADIIVQVNCVYTDSIASKDKYLSDLRLAYEINSPPKVFILECIDDSYQEVNEEFPLYIRVNPYDIQRVFPECKINFYKTYCYPNNRVSKMLYKICR